MPAARTVEEKSMDVLYERVAGLDVHKDTVVACVRIMVDGKTTRECRTFATTTEQLVALRAWLEECRCTHVAMEATGVYWMPVFRLLDADKFALIVANAAHIKNVPGRKTDMNDAMWIADLLACGLIQASFVPNEEVQELRALTRTRKQLVREQTRHVQRIEKTLAGANIKISSVICDIMGATSSPGPGCALGTTKVPASASPRACARGRPGSKPCSCNAPGPPSARKTATTGLNSSASKPSAGRKKPFAPSPHRSSPRSITSSNMAPNTMTSAVPTSIAGLWRSKRAGWLHISKSSASTSNYSQSRRPPDPIRPVVSS